jgi:hypothetical protein
MRRMLKVCSMDFAFQHIGEGKGDRKEEEKEKERDI